MHYDLNTVSQLTIPVLVTPGYVPYKSENTVKLEKGTCKIPQHVFN